MVQFSGPGKYLRPRSVTILRSPPAALTNPATFKLALEAFVLTAFPVATERNDQAWHADVTKSQRHSRSRETTSHPVESGFEITDHSRRLPDILAIDSLITETPLGLLAFISPLRGRALQQFNKLDEIFEAGEPVFVATSLKTYPSMIIDTFDSLRDENTGAAIGVSLTLKEIQIRSLNLFTSALPDDDALGLGAGGATDLGTTSTAVVG